MKLLFMVVAAALLFVPGAAAQESRETQESQQTPDEATLPLEGEESPEEDAAQVSVFSVWDFVRMVLILGAVIAAIYGVFYILKRSGNPKFQENRLIRVLSSKPIAGNRSLHLIEVGNQVFLVGAADNNLSLVSEIDDKETLDAIRLQSAEVRGEEKRNFQAVLSQMFGGTPKQQKNNGDPVGFLRQQRQRLKQL